MLRKLRFSNISEVWTKKTVVSSFLVANSLVWYYLVLFILQESVVNLGSDASLWILTSHFSALILSALAGAQVIKKTERNRTLSAWILLSVIVSLSLPLLNSSGVLTIGLIGLTVGIVFGFGMPICMSFFSDSASVERRGRASGLTLLITGSGLLSFMFILNSLGQWLVIVAALAIAWRLSSLAILVLLKASFFMQLKSKDESYMQILGKRSFLTYLIPWLMFSLVNYLTAPLVPGGDAEPSIIMVQAGFTAVFGIAGGVLIDRIGRKKIAISGFVFLGMGTAVLAIDPKSLISKYFNAGVDGIAWGLLLVLFILTIWGDLSNNSSTGKYYAIGVSPFFISKILETVLGAPLADFLSGSEFQYAFFSFTTLFLLVAILPLFYSPETLPEKILKDRDLKSYVEKAIKKAQIETKKDESLETEDETLKLMVKPSKMDEEYEEAQELAGKYY